MILAIAALRNLEVYQMDVKTSFLNRELNEEIYMEQPEGHVVPELAFPFKLSILVHSPKKKGPKKYGSLRAIQDMVLTDADRKKIDMVLRRLKKRGKSWVEKEISDDSFTSLDLRQRPNLLLQKAKTTIEFGRQVGFEIEGDPNEAILDLARIIENQS
ncbi:hypothetical protein GQ457_08G017360 [Hibiscus cannabinus]